jgi:hypothetical protein
LIGSKNLFLHGMLVSIEKTGGFEKKYLENVQNPRFVGDKEEIFVTEDALVVVIGECEQFVEWVLSEIGKLRPPKREGNA